MASSPMTAVQEAQERSPTHTAPVEVSWRTVTRAVPIEPVTTKYRPAPSVRPQVTFIVPLSIVRMAATSPSVGPERAAMGAAAGPVPAGSQSPPLHTRV